MEPIVRAELASRGGRASLALQNHIYGCFLFMEDVAEKKVTVENGVVHPFGWGLDAEFGKIGMRYGFVVDSQLILAEESEYKKAWMELLVRIARLAGNAELMAEVDAVEDGIIRMIREVVRPEEAFFIKALETGALSQDWMEKVVHLLSPTPMATPMATPVATPVALENVQASESSANVVVYPTRLQKHLDNPRRLFAHTRRHVQDRKKGVLATTRRQIVKA